jgi:uracil permease
MPVMGGIMVLLFGTIASIGLKTLIEAKVDLMEPRNLVIISVVLTAGIGGLELKFGSFGLVGVGLCSVLALMLNLILPGKSASHDGIVEGQDI